VSNGFFTAITQLNGQQSAAGTLTVAYDDGTTAVTSTENITVGVGPLHHIIISPAASVSRNDYHTFTAAGYDIYGNMITVPAFTWGIVGDVGTIDASGVFRGTRQGLGTVTATSVGIVGELPVFVSEPAGIFQDWLWLVIVLFIVVTILVVLLILQRRKDVYLIRPAHAEDEDADEPVDDADTDTEQEDEPVQGESPALEPEEIPPELREPLIPDLPAPEPAAPISDSDLEQQMRDLDALDLGEAEPAPEPEELKGQQAEQMRIERCEKMLSATVVLPDDKQKLRMMIDAGISVDDFSRELESAIERRKKREKSKGVTADEKASILEDELVAELAELEDELGNGKEKTEEALEDEILKELDDLENL
jgi:hypothetical protein